MRSLAHARPSPDYGGAVTEPYESLTDFIAIPRIDGLALSPDGSRAVLTVATLNKDATAYERALWEVPATPGATGDPVRLTRSAKGEAGAVFTAAGDVLFTSTRPDAGAEGEDEKPQLWLLPARGGEARCISRLAGGVSGIAAVAADANAAVLGADLMPSADSLEDDARIRAARTKGKVNAILHSSYPIRDWDHDLGPAEPHLLALDLASAPTEVARASAASPKADSVEGDGANGDADATTPYPETLPRPRDLTPKPGRSTGDRGVAVSPDGATVIAALQVPVGRSSRSRLVSIDVASGAHTVLADEEGIDFVSPVISPDGTTLAYGRGAKSTPVGPADQELWIANLDGSGARQIAAEWDRWAASTAFSADGSALIVTADHDGRCPVFSIDVTTGEVTQITTDDAAYSAVAVDRTGAGLVALRATMLEPAHPVRISSDGAVTRLANPAPAPAVNAELTDVDATAEDGTRVRAWLLTPPGASAASPAPLLLWIHGGPLNSWNQWSWRWSPALAVARGYAVLLPDPALSTGYGLDFIARGWNSWGHKPYTDLLTITDAVEARPEIDGARTAAMGGSFGGYMANWIAGHTHRFDAIVTHAALWSLDQFSPTTDHADYWQSIFTPEAMVEHSPHHFVDAITSPMLVIHGDKDYRVPIGEGLRLWAELAERFAAPDGTMDHRFLYFPDENHWILKPQHAVVWYETVFAFLSQHVLGERAELPEVLG
ncbi:S9 family peptidase [Demequina sp. SO4-18]|uniref:S9 family peptidase n=1 Tax=Demequina sp. SO4-18 TaxID=3401026 RepID=UPI003B5B1BBC